MFWKRKKSDFISLNLSGPDEPVDEAVEQTIEPKVEVESVKLSVPTTPIAELPKIEAPVVTTERMTEPVIEAPKPAPVVEVPKPVQTVEPPAGDLPDDEGFMKRFRKAITSTRENIATRIEDAVKGKKEIDAATLDELEEALIGADIGVQTTMEIIDSVRKQVDRQTLKDPDELKRTIKQHLLDILENAERSRGVASETSVPDDVRPYVMMIVGVNGVGKTTTIGKLAQRIKAEGNEILICAADTFRAAASDQLAIWADRAGVPLIQQKQGTDPAAVLFDSLKAAKARNADVLIVDTAGRLHNKANLMAELEKMKRIANREVPGAPHEVLLVVDAVTGQNGLSQAREFMKAADITGLVLTKLDGTAKGGIAVAIAKELNLPIRYCGIGEQADDLVVFDPKAYVESLFE